MINLIAQEQSLNNKIVWGKEQIEHHEKEMLQ